MTNIFREIDRKDMKPVITAFLHFFLVIFSYYVIKPVRDSLFVKTIGPENLPYFYLASAFIVFFVVTAYNHVIKYFDNRRFILFLQIAVTLNILLFWLLYRIEFSITSHLFYIWAGIYNIFLVTMFWSLTNDIFTKDKGRTYYGIIGGGGILGGIAGSWTTSWLPLRIGTHNCLLLAAALLVLCVIVTLFRLGDGNNENRENIESKKKTNIFKDISLILSNRQVLLIAKIIFFMTLGKSIFNYHYYHIIDSAITDQDQTTSFFAMVYTATNISSALIQFILTTWILRKSGARLGLLFTPIALALCMLSLLVPGVILTVLAVFVVLQQSTSYSINQSSKEILYTPMSDAVKYRAKAVIDMFVFRFGDATASILILVLHNLLHLPKYVSALVCLACIGYWLHQVVTMKDPLKNE